MCRRETSDLKKRWREEEVTDLCSAGPQVCSWSEQRNSPSEPEPRPLPVWHTHTHTHTHTHVSLWVSQLTCISQRDGFINDRAATETELKYLRLDSNIRRLHQLVCWSVCRRDTSLTDLRTDLHLRHVITVCRRDTSLTDLRTDLHPWCVVDHFRC